MGARSDRRVLPLLQAQVARPLVITEGVLLPFPLAPRDGEDDGVPDGTVQTRFIRHNLPPAAARVDAFAAARRHRSGSKCRSRRAGADCPQTERRRLKRVALSPPLSCVPPVRAPARPMAPDAAS